MYGLCVEGVGCFLLTFSRSFFGVNLNFIHFDLIFSLLFISFLLLDPIVIDNSFSRRLGQRKLQCNKVAWIYNLMCFE